MTGTITVGNVVVDIDATAMGIIGADAVMAVLVEDVVPDVDAVEGLPDDDAVGAVVGHDVVVDFHIGNGVIARDLETIAGVGEENIIEDDLVLAAEIESMVQ